MKRSFQTEGERAEGFKDNNVHYNPNAAQITLNPRGRINQECRETDKRETRTPRNITTGGPSHPMGDLDAQPLRNSRIRREWLDIQA